VIDLKKEGEKIPTHRGVSKRPGTKKENEMNHSKRGTLWVALKQDTMGEGRESRGGTFGRRGEGEELLFTGGDNYPICFQPSDNFSGREEEKGKIRKIKAYKREKKGVNNWAGERHP